MRKEYHKSYKISKQGFQFKKRNFERKKKPLYKLFPSYTVWHVTRTLQNQNTLTAHLQIFPRPTGSGQFGDETDLALLTPKLNVSSSSVTQPLQSVILKRNSLNFNQYIFYFSLLWAQEIFINLIFRRYLFSHINNRSWKRRLKVHF